MGNNNNMTQSSASSYGYGNNNVGGGGGGYQRMGGAAGGNSDYPRKYSHQTSPGAGGQFGDASPPPYKRNRKDWEMNNESNRSGMHDSYNPGYQGNYNAMNQKAHMPNQTQ